MVKWNMAKVSKEDLDMVAVLSRLEVPEQDKEKHLRQLDSFLQYVDNLSKVPTDQVEPLAHVLPIHNVFREDEVRPSLDRELALSNAPLQEDGYFKVPKILED
jgi:aspartyl-tRNA(Asn)/glutamyl-tRNA(Gln) amidotransferase subunit C